MKKLSIILPLIALVLFLFSKKNEPILIPITFSDCSLPLVTTTINNQELILELVLNAKYPLFLNKNHIHKLNSKEIGIAQWQNSNSESRTAPLFHLNQIKVGPLTIKHPQAALTNEEDLYGSFTWPLEKQSIFLDFSNRRIYGATNPKDLLSLGYDIKKMRKIDCQMNPIGITFKAHTSLGELNLALSTSGAKNVIESSKTATALITPLIVNNYEIENTQFFPTSLPKELEIDGVLGVEFLKKHIIYIDSKQRSLYIADSHPNTFAKHPTSKIPIIYTQSGIPSIEIKVNNTPYMAKIDLGSSWELTLPSEQFSPDTNPLFTKKQMNALGNEQPIEGYLCSNWQIGNGLIKNGTIVKASLKSVDLQLSLADLGPLPSHQLGLIGYPLLYRSNIFFDFPNSTLCFSTPPLETFFQVPFELKPWGLIVNIQTDLGLLNFLLDTGATVTLIKNLPSEQLTTDSNNNPRYITQDFILGNYHYQNQCLYPFDLTSKLPSLDGILGMDFLRSHSLYIDFPNRTLYLKPTPQAVNY